MPEAMTTCEWCGEDCDLVWEFTCRECKKIFHECSDCCLELNICKKCGRKLKRRIDKKLKERNKVNE